MASISTALIRRLRLAEDFIGVDSEPSPAIFIRVVDASRGPDPGAPRGPRPYDEADIVGFTSRGQRVSRAEGESIAALKARVKRLLRGPVFMPAYATHSREHFDSVPEADERATP